MSNDASVIIANKDRMKLKEKQTNMRKNRKKEKEYNKKQKKSQKIMKKRIIKEFQETQ